MKMSEIRSIVGFSLIIVIALSGFALVQEPWTPEQLQDTFDLAQKLNDTGSKPPIVVCIGPGASIKNSIDIGPAKEKENLQKFEKYLSTLSKDANIVIYCGCCPFSKCPNIRPAFQLLNNMKFANHKLLNIPNNLKTDWIDKGYPVVN